MTNLLADQLEVWGFEEGCLIFKDYSLGTVLKLTARNGSSSTDEELNRLHVASGDFLNGLPSGISLQFVQVIEAGAQPYLDQHRALAANQDQGLVERLTEVRLKRLLALDQAGEIPSPGLYLIIRRPFKGKGSGAKRKWKFWKKASASSGDEWSQDALAPELNSFEQLILSIRGGLDALGVGSVRLTEEQIFSLLFDQWNPGFPLEGLNFNQEDIRDDLLLGDLVVSIKGFSIGSVHHRVLSLKIMPDQTFASMSEKLRELPFDSRLFLSIETLDQGRETFALETQRRIAYAMYAGKKGVSDLTSEAKFRDIESLLSKRVTGEEKIFSASLSVILRSDQEAALEEQVRQVLQTFRELSGAEGMVESLAAASIFLELALPHARSRERARRMNTSVLADFLPILGEWKGHAEPRVLLRNRRGTLLGFDPFSPQLTNFNQVVSGGSGAGKSFMTNVLIAQLMKEDPLVFILDIGGSYRKMTQALDGQYIPLGTDSTIALNPFDLVDRSVEAIDQKIKFMVSLVELMTKEDEASGIGKLERSVIEQFVKEVLQDEVAPQLSHLRAKLLANPEPLLQRMGKILGPWCGDSPFGKFIDRPSNLELTKKMVCFDLKGLESQPDLQAVCLFLITDLIWREVQRNRTRMKVVVFDECWRLLESAAGARFIGEVFRTFRKYRASAIAISQTMDDFAKSKVASAILPNASVKWVLKQTGGNLQSLQETLLLNERELSLVESVTSRKGYFSEAFLIAGDDRQVVVVESTPLEYWLATTDTQDLKILEQEGALHPTLSMTELLTHLAGKYPRGACEAVSQHLV